MKVGEMDTPDEHDIVAYPPKVLLKQDRYKFDLHHVLIHPGHILCIHVTHSCTQQQDKIHGRKDREGSDPCLVSFLFFFTQGMRRRTNGIH